LGDNALESRETASTPTTINMGNAGLAFNTEV
jgi:hypothetical protein